MKVWAVVYRYENAMNIVEVLAVFTDYDDALKFAKDHRVRDPEYAIYETTLNPEMT